MMQQPFFLFGLCADNDIVFPAWFMADDLRVALVFGVGIVHTEQGRKFDRASAVFQIDKAGVRTARPVFVPV